MNGRVRSELSKKSTYYISKEKFYELKHFCLQYPEWKKELSELKCNYTIKSPMIKGIKLNIDISDYTARRAIEISSIDYKIKLVEECVRNADKEIADYLLLAVTEGISYDILRYVHGMPCGKDMFYDRYHKFFWLLSLER